jgi:hypothetical protein
MVSAISSQAATLNPLAYTAQPDEEGTQQAAPDATANDSDRGPATQVSLSQDAMDHLNVAQLPVREIGRQAPPSSRGTDPAMQKLAEAMTPEALDKFHQLHDLNLKISEIDRNEAARDSNTAALARFQASYEKTRDTPPKPAVVLNAADTEKALQMLKDAGVALTIPGKDGNFGYGKDGIQYMFRGDGTVTTQEESVATSFEMQQKMLSADQEAMSYYSNLLQDRSGERAALAAQRDALLGTKSGSV